MSFQTISQEILDKLLLKLGLEASVETSFQEDTLVLTLHSESRGLLIGFHGENLQALQSILRLILFRVVGEWHPVIVDVDGYRTERLQKLQEVTMRAVQKSRFLNAEVALPPMSNADRREVHLILARIEGVAGESVEEGASRHIVIHPV